MHRILQVGSSPKETLEKWLEKDEIGSVVVLEPHQQHVQQLKKQYSDQSKLQIVAAALSTQFGVQTLVDYNLPGFSSVSPATGLKRLFPGLQIQQHFEVNTLSPAEFLEQYGPEVNQTATLVIQAKGYEAELVRELVNSPYLLSFTEVLLYTASALLYEHSTETAVLQQQLVEVGYELLHEQAISPEWIESSFKRNTAQDEILLLRQQLKEKDQLIQAQAVQHQCLESALAESEAEHQKAIVLAEQLEADLKQTKQAEKAAVIAQEQLQAEVKALQQIIMAEKTAAEKYAQQIKTLQADLEKAKQEISLTLENTKKELLAKDNSLMLQQQELVSVKQNQQQVSKQLQETQAKLKEHEQWLRNRKKQVEELEQALQQEQEKNKQLHIEQAAVTELQSRMELLFNQQASQIQQATNALGKHVTKSFVDQRQHNQALVGLQQYLENGEQPLNFDAWSMGVDTITHLVRQIEQNNYDVIIEFGSGTSTVVMAKAIAQRLTSQRYSQITKNDSNKHLPYQDIESHDLSSVSGSQAAALLDKAEYDLPRQVISFEQDRNYLNQTKQALASHGVSQMVELVLAPLVPTTHSSLPAEQKPLFYDCEKQLERLARLFEQRNARILVVVDGPFSPKNNPLIREPALGVVLQYLSAQHLDILLDDSHRSGEQQVLEHWQELCEERGLTYKAQALDVVKGATWVTVRPE